MEPFSRDPPSLTGYGTLQLSSSSSYYPQSSGHIGRSQRHLPRSRSHPARTSPGPYPLPKPSTSPGVPSHPLTPPALPGVPVIPGQQPIDAARKITPPEEKDIHAQDEQPAVVDEYKSPYDEAFEYIQECKGLRPPCRHLEDYEKPLAIKISIRDWMKLSHDLDLNSEDES